MTKPFTTGTTESQATKVTDNPGGEGGIDPTPSVLILEADFSRIFFPWSLGGSAISFSATSTPSGVEGWPRVLPPSVHGVFYCLPFAGPASPTNRLHLFRKSPVKTRVSPTLAAGVEFSSISC